MSKPATSPFTDEDIAFLGTERKVDAETVKVGYIKNLEYPVKQQYENIYKRVIDPAFVLCFHCSNEVFNMVKKLQELYAGQATKAVPAASAPEEIIPTPKEVAPIAPTIRRKVIKADFKKYPELKGKGLKAGDLYDFPVEADAA
jgi:hypothetical protein